MKGKLLISAFSTATQLLAKTRSELTLKVTKINKTSKESIDQSVKVGANYLNARYAHLESLEDNFDSEKRRTRRGEHKGNKNDKKRPKEATPIIDKSNVGAQGSLGRTTYQRTT